MTDSVAIAQEQVAWWLAEGYTPREALRCLGAKGTKRGWGRVLDMCVEIVESDFRLTGQRQFWLSEESRQAALGRGRVLAERARAWRAKQLIAPRAA